MARRLTKEVVKTTTHTIFLTSRKWLRGYCEVMKKRFERWQQKKRFILRMWKRGYKGMPKQGWIKWNW